MSPNRRIAIALFALLVLSAGCGKKGPLYQPGDDSGEKVPDERAAQQQPQNPPPSLPGY